eukprot:CAMPEP_0114244948 /NCGR_PEP_ID=MMETSP0058-20121206/11620_1 /TAXON_ID=36894 /ORGANISM="Pyramimonas parkeae, CCMP726" /LENGTH=110 /DNA_ID=CAMNT_0001357939 /DNA_START=146 /DNA_END=478 /DNA_ORIENTATION=-
MRLGIRFTHAEVKSFDDVNDELLMMRNTQRRTAQPEGRGEKQDDYYGPANPASPSLIFNTGHVWHSAGSELNIRMDEVIPDDDALSVHLPTQRALRGSADTRAKSTIQQS